MSIAGVRIYLTVKCFSRVYMSVFPSCEITGLRNGWRILEKFEKTILSKKPVRLRDYVLILLPALISASSSPVL